MPAARSTTRHVVAHVLRDNVFAGYRVAVLSDFHFAPWRSSRFLSQAVDAVNAWHADLIALGGDYGYSFRFIPPLSRACYRAVIPRIARELSRLSARDGVYAVLGNHDQDGGTQIVEAGFASVGVHVLRNELRAVTRGDSTLAVAGIDSPLGLRELGTMPSNAAAILFISHHPDAIREWHHLSSNRPSLVVAGHTHGGQIAFPVFGAPVTLSHVATRRFPAGFVPNEHTMLYVSRGLGEQVSLRIGAPRELTLLELAER